MLMGAQSLDGSLEINDSQGPTNLSSSPTSSVHFDLVSISVAVVSKARC